ncbi:MAG: hypothetical protein ABIB71_06465 [Candidatus Woesearchaeota archaeon]
MEETINGGKDKAAYQLKKLLGKKEKQDLGDVERWKQIPVEYIVTANTLGIELNDHALKRLNEAKDKEHAFESIYVTQYFAKEARKLQKHDLAEKLEAMVEDESLATENLALYASKAIEDTLPKDKLLEKLAKAYSVDKKIQDVLPKVQELPQKGNTIDIILIPTDTEKAYVHVGELPESLENLVINVYSKDEGSKEEKQVAFNYAKENLKKNIDQKLKDFEKNFSDTKKISVGSNAGGLGAICLGAGIGAAATQSWGGALIGGGIGGLLEVAALMATAVLWGGYGFHELKGCKKYRNKKEQFQKCFQPERINWIKDDGLEFAYNQAMSEKDVKPRGYDNEAVKKAVSSMLSNANSIGVVGKFSDVYTKQMDLDKGKDMKISLKKNGKDNK